MEKLFNRIKSILSNISFWNASTFDEDGYSNDDSEKVVYLTDAMDEVDKIAEEYSNCSIVKWYSVLEKVPENSIGQYLVTLKNGVVTEANYIIDEFSQSETPKFSPFPKNNPVIAWAYLPIGYSKE